MCAVLMLRQTCGRAAVRHSWSTERGHRGQCFPTCQPVLQLLTPNGPITGGSPYCQGDFHSQLWSSLWYYRGLELPALISTGCTALKMQDDRHEDLWHFSLLVCIFSCFIWQDFTDRGSNFSDIMWVFFFLCANLIKLHSTSVQYCALLREREAVIYCWAGLPRNTMLSHWQEAHSLTPPVAGTGGAPYKEVKYLPLDKCVYPPISAYHKLEAPGPCMDCVCTSAKLQRGKCGSAINLTGPLTSFT